MNKKKFNLGVMALPEDKELIQKVCRQQRRSVASFLIESAIIRAKQILKEGKDGATR